MSNARRSSARVISIPNPIVVQFEEKKFLESARKVIQSSVSQAGAKLEAENVIRYDPNKAE